jgi:5'-3' exoribonuclease 2
MLSLITHEPHFYIIRESINANNWKKCDYCGYQGHLRSECHKYTGVVEEKVERKDITDSIEFSILKISVLREYLAIEVHLLASSLKSNSTSRKTLRT